MKYKYNLDHLSESDNQICIKFSEESVGTSLDEYSRRNQNDKRKIENDIFWGKTAEYMVYNLLKENVKSITKPDVEIYDKYHKTFDADLILNDNINLHVKSRLNSSNIPNSWVFHPTDELVIKPNSNDYLALCVLSTTPYMYMMKASDVIYKDPALERLIGKKKVIYESDVENFIYNNV